MQRDMDLFRAILLEVEQTPVGQFWTSKPMLEHSQVEVVEHVRLLGDDGLVEARYAVGGYQAKILRMTNSGHDFLETSRELKFWEKIKERTKSAAVPVTIAVIKSVSDVLIKEHLHL